MQEFIDLLCILKKECRKQVKNWEKKYNSDFSISICDGCKYEKECREFAAIASDLYEPPETFKINEIKKGLERIGEITK